MGLKQLLKKNKTIFQIAKKVKKTIKVLWELNLYKTFIINIKTQRLATALKFPIFVYGKVKFYSLKGKITIDAPIRRGMIKFGNNTDLFSASKGSAMLNILGELIFSGYASISVDYLFDISGKCVIGKYAGIGNGVKIRCWNKIVIGDSARIAVETQIFDTNFHYTRNINTGEVYRSSTPIKIGNFCWIGNRTTLMKGTVLPDYSIVAGNSLLNKDYTKENVIAPTIAGTPAKIIGFGNVRIFGMDHESEINKFFIENTDTKVFQSFKGIKDEMDDLETAFK